MVESARDGRQVAQTRGDMRGAGLEYLAPLHYGCDPADLTEDQVRRYFLFLRQDKKLSGSGMTIVKACLHCFFVQQLGKTDWKVFSELVIRRPETLPVVLSREEVAKVLGARTL